MTSTLEIRLLGGLHLVWDGAPLSNFMSNKVPALLAFLAVNRRPHSREALAGLLWGGLPEADARNNLRQALTSLRKLVGPHVRIDRESVEFNVAAPYFLDVKAFERHVQAAVGMRPAPQAEHWQAASALYQGDFLAGFSAREAPEFEEWLLAQRAHYHELAVHTLHALTRVYAASGEAGRAVDAAARLLAIDPWREEAHRQLMLLKARTGQRSAALAQYETCRRILAQDLGVEPSPETTALYERLLAAQRGPRHNLPGSLTGFVGREAELVELKRRLADLACRLVTLTGPGGIGKTRLALQAAAEHVDVFINGVWFAPLTAAGAETLVEHLADAVGLELKAGNPKRQLLNFLRAKELLLVLDNFEHLVDSAGLTLPGDAAADPAAYSAGQLFLQAARRHHSGFQLAASEWPAVQALCRHLDGMPLGLELAAARTQVMACSELVAEIRRGLDFLASTRRDVPERQRSLRVVMEASWRALTEAERTAFAGLSVFPASFTAAAAESVAGATPALLNGLVGKSLVRQVADRYELHEVLRRFAGEALAGQSGQPAAWPPGMTCTSPIGWPRPTHPSAACRTKGRRWPPSPASTPTCAPPGSGRWPSGASRR